MYLWNMVNIQAIVRAGWSIKKYSIGDTNMRWRCKHQRGQSCRDQSTNVGVNEEIKKQYLKSLHGDWLKVDYAIPKY